MKVQNEGVSFLYYLKNLKGLIQVEKVQSAVLSSKQKDSLLMEVESIDQHTRQSQQVLRQNLEYLAKQTISYQVKLREYREQLRQRQILNQKTYSSKIMEMIEEFELMKQRCDEIKGQNLAFLFSQQRAAQAYLVILRHLWHCKILKTKQAIVERKALRDLVPQLLTNVMAEEKISKQTLTDKYRLHRLKQHYLNALKMNWYCSKIQFYNKLPPQRIIIHKDRKAPKLECCLNQCDLDIEPEDSFADDQQLDQRVDNVNVTLPNQGSAVRDSTQGSRLTMVIQQLEENEPIYFKIPAPDYKTTVGSDGNPVVNPGQIKHITINLSLDQRHVHGHNKACERHRSLQKQQSKQMSYKPQPLEGEQFATFQNLHQDNGKTTRFSNTLRERPRQFTWDHQYPRQFPRQNNPRGYLQDPPRVQQEENKQQNPGVERVIKKQEAVRRIARSNTQFGVIRRKNTVMNAESARQMYEEKKAKGFRL